MTSTVLLVVHWSQVLVEKWCGFLFERDCIDCGSQFPECLRFVRGLVLEHLSLANRLRFLSELERLFLRHCCLASLVACS